MPVFSLYTRPIDPVALNILDDSFFLIYKTKCLRNHVLKFTYIQDQVRPESRFKIYLYTRPSEPVALNILDASFFFPYIQDQLIQ